MATELVCSALDTALFYHELRHRRRENALADLAAFARDRGVVRDPERLLAALRRREPCASSAPLRGAAILHARSLAVLDTHVVIAPAPRGLEWKPPGTPPVTLVIAVFAVHDHPLDAYFALIARAADAARLQRRRARLASPDAAVAFAAWREGA